MTIKRTLVTVGRKISKHSPALFIAGGIVGFGATAYLAYKSKDKVEAVVEDIEERRSVGEPVYAVKAAGDLAGALWLPITTGVLSTASIIMAHSIQRKRILALSGALAAQQAQNFIMEKKYKQKHGEKAFNKFMEPTMDVESITTDDKGKEVKTVDTIAMEIDKSIGQWYYDSAHYVSDDHNYNKAYLESVKETLETRMFHKGSILLNEVLVELGYEPIRQGALLGWTAADHFDLMFPVIKTNAAGQEPEQAIWTTWTRPRYIYDDVDYTGRYAPFNN